MNKLQKIFLVLSLGLFAGAAAAHPETYWVDSAGNMVKDGDGHCLHAANWRSNSDCDPHAADSKPAPAPMVKQAEPVKTSPAPRYRQLSLASGASFELGGSKLSPAGKAAVAELAGKFKGETIKQVIVEGHTDDRGAASFNLALSQKRAQAVKTELVANGIAAQVIETIGRGETMPVADNNTSAGRAKNRRVEIKVDAARRTF